MNGIKNIHKVLAALTVLVIAGQIIAYFYILAPGDKDVKKAEGSLNMSKSELRRNAWPSDIKVLRGIKQKYQDRLEGTEDGKSMAQLTEKTMSLAGSTFSSVISRDYSSITEFMRNASRLDYQAEHSRAFSDMAKRGFILAPESVGLDENDPSPYIYQLMLHLWTVEKLVSMAADSGLVLQAVPQPSRSSRRQISSQPKEPEANLSVLPMKTYTTGNGRKPYLLEFPVRIKLKGSLPQTLKFLSDLQQNNAFIPASSFEMFAVPPETIVPSNDGTIVPGMLHLNLICSSFLPLPEAEK